MTEDKKKESWRGFFFLFLLTFQIALIADEDHRAGRGGVLRFQNVIKQFPMREREREKRKEKGPGQRR
jgi:hypothetical protein